MANYNLNYLQKDELTYELLARGEDVKNDSVEELRRQLRKCISCVTKPENLSGKYTLKEEFETIKSKLDFIEVLVDQTTENTSKLSLAKIKAKLSHLSLRISNLSKCQLDETYKQNLEALSQKQKSLSEKFESLKTPISQEELLKFEENLNKSFIEDEEQVNKISETLNASMNITSSPQNIKTTPVFNLENEQLEIQDLHACTTNIPPEPLSINQSQSLKRTSIFNKMSNPIEKLVNKFVITNGLEISELLLFLRNLSELRTQTNLNTNQIYELLPGFTTQPLLSKVLECKNTSCNLDQLHSQIISTFLPVTLREKLKQDLVLRPQKPREPLSIYINEIKINSQILQTGFSESEIVSLIKIGLCPEIRNKLIFETNPTSFKDLDQLCISVNNIQYNDFLRNQLFNPSGTHQKGPISENSSNYNPNKKVHYTSVQNQHSDVKTCFNCHKKGHVAKQCYRPKNTKNF